MRVSEAHDDDDDDDDACVRCMPPLPTLPLTTSTTSAAVASSSSSSQRMPVLGMGTYELRGEACVRAVCRALQMGYRLLDTAAVYRNEALVGEGIKRSGVPRAELFVTVKLAMKTMHSAAAVRAGVVASVQALQIGYADCVLVHWPGCGGRQPDDAAAHTAARARCWRVLAALQREGVTRHVGVSNFLPRHFDALYADDEHTTHDDNDDNRNNNNNNNNNNNSMHTCCDDSQLPVPAIDQIELHPLCVQDDVVRYCRARGIVVQQYSPLGKGSPVLLQHAQLRAVHARYFAPGYSVAAVLVLWGLACGFCTLVRSRRAAHARELYAAALRFFDVACDDDDDGELAALLPPPLTQTQRDVLRDLRAHMHVDADTHLCWDSSSIA